MTCCTSLSVMGHSLPSMSPSIIYPSFRGNRAWRLRLGKHTLTSDQVLALHTQYACFRETISIFYTAKTLPGKGTRVSTLRFIAPTITNSRTQHTSTTMTPPSAHPGRNLSFPNSSCLPEILLTSYTSLAPHQTSVITHRPTSTRSCFTLSRFVLRHSIDRVEVRTLSRHSQSRLGDPLWQDGASWLFPARPSTSRSPVPAQVSTDPLPTCVYA